ncbi:MAG: rod shape-determining protein [Candidatus Dadabacteria bacterium]|nr:rod shape-determining protein [Candidatus Dadabacteria bacterium]
MLDRFLEYFSNDLAIDLGTANTLVYLKGKGIVSNEPSVVAVQHIPGQKSRLIAVGRQAREMVGRTPDSIKAIRPLRDGVIADFEAAQKMIEYFIKKSNGNKRSLVRPRVIISVPLQITEVEKRAVRESAEAAGARKVYLIEETMCAAIGSGIEVDRPSGNMVVDIGGGTTGIAVISLSGIVVSKSIKIGGDRMDEAIQQWLRKSHNIVIGYRTAEELKKKFSSLPEINTSKKTQLKVTGRNNISGVPSMLTIDSEEIGEAVEETINQIVDAIMQTLEETPPELSADVFESGITLAGGGSLLRGLRDRIEQKTGIQIKRAEHPLDCVVIGSGKALEDIDFLNSIAI